MNVARFEKISKKQFLTDTYDLLEGKEVIYEDICLPKRATVGSAGYDFYSPCDISIPIGEMVKIPTGIRCFIENGYVLHLYPRSSLGFRYQIQLANTVGIIDSDYYLAENEGHIIIALVNRGKKDVMIKKGDRFAQGVFLAYFTAEEEEVKETRTGGFGSSDKKMRP